MSMVSSAAQHWGGLPVLCLGTMGFQAAAGTASTIKHAGLWDGRVLQCQYVKCRIVSGRNECERLNFNSLYVRMQNSQISFEEI